MRDEAQRQINLLLQQQEELAPELYRDLALYLQVLREGLLHAVQQACFHLATQVRPERYARLVSAGASSQVQLLEAEGVVFFNGRTSLEEFRWEPRGR